MFYIIISLASHPHLLYIYIALCWHCPLKKKNPIVQPVLYTQIKKAKRERSDSTLPSLDELFKQNEKRRKCSKDLVEHFVALSQVELNSTDLSSWRTSRKKLRSVG